MKILRERILSFVIVYKSWVGNGGGGESKRMENYSPYQEVNTIKIKTTTKNNTWICRNHFLKGSQSHLQIVLNKAC